MIVQGLGACRMMQLLRGERARDLDSSWLLHGPTEEPAELADQLVAANEEEPIPAWRYAAE